MWVIKDIGSEAVKVICWQNGATASFPSHHYAQPPAYLGAHGLVNSL
jgi:hypothetical protein